LEPAIAASPPLNSSCKSLAKESSHALEFGVSVVICVYNGAVRLPATLEHLKKQRGCDDLKWEVLIVDNASTDGTAEVARRCWAAESSATMRIIRESRLGLTYARECALEHASYELVSFIDDDNWVSETWVRRVVEAMTAHPEAAAIGGYCAAVPEITPPQWFARFKNYYAIGPDYDRGAEVPMLWGAGLNLRKSAWRGLRAGGFRFLTTTQCEDQEICLAARLAGWKLRFDPELRLQHFIPAGRLTWDYFRALQRKRTGCLVMIDPYLAALEKPDSVGHSAANGVWRHQFGLTIRNLLLNLLRRPHKVLGRSSPHYEGDDDVLRIENYLGRLEGLFRERRNYAPNLDLVAGALWRNTGPAARA
jgi:glycosyltransferase involved in cell wall biosynthesis